MVKDARPSRLDPYRVGDRQPIQDRPDRLQQPGCERLFVFGGQCRNETDIHHKFETAIDVPVVRVNLPQLFCAGGAKSALGKKKPCEIAVYYG